MNLIEELKSLADRIPEYQKFMEYSKQERGREDNEQATIHVLVMPFLNLLGYDERNPREVWPDYPVDPTVTDKRKQKKVDLAIFKDGEPVMIIECKAYGWLSHESWAKDPFKQLRRYFKKVKDPFTFAVLTDGRLYRFYTDLEQSNIMDNTPFLELNLCDIQPVLVDELKRFTKSAFDLEEALEASCRLKKEAENCVKKFAE